jgi:hypothetical protein
MGRHEDPMTLQRVRDMVSNIAAVVLCVCAVVLAILGTVLLVQAILR